MRQSPISLLEREQRADRMAELLECLADLVVELGEQRARIEHAVDPSDLTARGVVGQLADLERMLTGVGLEAAAVHQLLRQEQLI